MTEPEFLEPDVVLFVHDQALREYGGVQGLKDEGLLHSALGRPVNKLAYAEPGLFDLAAAYAYGLASNHAFNDANKRTAWACCVLFLESLSRNLGFLQRERKPSKFSYFRRCRKMLQNGEGLGQLLQLDRAARISASSQA